jgi:hypothetical protein
MFLPGGKLLVYSQGKPGVHDRKEYYSHSFGTEPNYPIVVMVNSSSASASEILSGALRDHKRATLVGEKTFGKGSVQQLLWIRTTGRRTCLKLTIAKYYLPNGDCIHKKGIEPDIKVNYPELSMASFEARRKLINSLIISDYISENFKKHEKKFRELIAFDHENPKLYPEFSALKEKIKKEEIEISDQDIRHEIRRALVTYMESQIGEPLIVDIQENPALQRAVIEIRNKIEAKEKNKVPLYTWYSQKVKERELEAEKKKAKMYPPPPEDRKNGEDDEEEDQ